MPQGREKRYVGVVSETDTAGNTWPKQIIWQDGARYDVDKVLAVRPAWSQKALAKGLRYSIRVEGQETYLYYENPRWFVEAKV